MAYSLMCFAKLCGFKGFLQAFQLASRDAGGRRRFWCCLPGEPRIIEGSPNHFEKMVGILSYPQNCHTISLRKVAWQSFQLISSYEQDSFTSRLPHLTLRFQFQRKCCPLPTSVDRLVTMKDQVTTDTSCLHRDDGMPLFCLLLQGLHYLLLHLCNKKCHFRETKNRFGRAGRQYDVSGSISTIISLTAQTNALPVACEFTNCPNIPGRFCQELNSGWVS